MVVMTERGFFDDALCCAALGLALSICFSAERAAAYCQMSTEGSQQVGNSPCVERGEPLVWTYPCLSYAVDSRGSRWFEDLGEVEFLVDESFAAWQQADCDGSPPNLIFKPLNPSTCRRPQFNERGPNVNTIAFLDPWRDPCADADDPGYDPFAFAVTIVWHDTRTGEILDADMMINDQRASSAGAGGPYADCPETGCPATGPGGIGPADLRSIVTHEAGHFIGIGHSGDENATMFASAERSSVSKRRLAQDDIAAVCNIYPPDDLDASCNASPIGGLQLDCEVTASGNPIACDRPVATPRTSGCSAGRAPAEAPWAALVAALVGLIGMRRRSDRRGARS